MKTRREFIIEVFQSLDNPKVVLWDFGNGRTIGENIEELEKISTSTESPPLFDSFEKSLKSSGLTYTEEEVRNLLKDAILQEYSRKKHTFIKGSMLC